METKQKQGCLMWTILTAGLAILANAVQIVTGWEEFKRTLQNASEGIAGFFIALREWFAAPVSLPRWILTLITFILAIGAIYAIGRVLEIRRRSELKKAKFRELWLFFQVDYKTDLPIVLNRRVEEARCGECMGAIVSTDVGRSGRRVQFLKCENEHFVGGRKTYSEYQSELEIAFQESKRRQREREKQAEEEYQKLLKDLDEGKITQQEFDNKMMEPPRPEPLTGNFAMPDPPPPFSAQELYAEVVREFEQQHIKQQLMSIKTFSVEQSQ